MSHRHATLEDTVYFWFAANDTSGSGADGATPVYDVRLGGAAANVIPTLSGAATLLTHANYPDGAHEVAIAATAANGFAAGNTYGVFCTLLADGQNPTGFIGSFTLGPVPADMTHIHGSALTETAGQLAAAFTHFFDVAAPSGTINNLYSFAASAAAWGSINSGVVFRGTVTAAVPGVSFTVGGLAGQGVGAFIDPLTPWYAYVFRDAGGLAAAPQGEHQRVTGYTSASGLFTTDAFTQPVAAGDDVIIMSGRIAAIPDILEDTGTTIPALLNQIIADLPTKPTKNVAISGFQFFMVLTSDHVTGATGLAITAERSLDGAAFAACANAASEIGNGVYKIDLAASDMNGDTVCLKFTAGTADTRVITIVTQST